MNAIDEFHRTNTDAEIVLRPLDTERWNHRDDGFHVYLRTTCDVGPCNTPGPYTYTGLLKRGRVFRNILRALIFAVRFRRHNRRKYRTIKIVREGL